MIKRSLMTALVTFFIAVEPTHAYGNGYQVELEAGGLLQSRNLMQSPNSASAAMQIGSRFSLKKIQGSGPSPYLRLSAAYTWNEKHRVSILYAPLKIVGTRRLDNTISFQGISFAMGEKTRALYRFDSYRVGYRYKMYDSDPWQFWLGMTIKLRDANVVLSQGPLKTNRANTGLVPLLSAHLRKSISPSLSFILDAEGLAAPQGRALDAAVKLRYQLQNGAGVSAGYRMLEGGAGNKKIYTFAWIHYGLLAFDYRF